MLPGGDLEKDNPGRGKERGLQVLSRERERERCGEVSLGRLKGPLMLG